MEDIQTRRFFRLILLGVSSVVFLYTMPQYYKTNSPKHLQVLWHFLRKNGTTNDTQFLNNYLYPKPWRLLNIDLSYLVNNDVCGSNDVFMLILITSHCGNTEFRQQIRDAFPFSELEELSIRRIFLLAKVDLNNQNRLYPNVSADAIRQENHNNGDIIIGDFLEDYRNLTYKHLMGLEYASRFCSQAQYLIKQDDDTVVDYYQIIHLLKNSELGETLAELNVIFGKVLQDLQVLKNSDSKWYVTNEEFNHDKYPTFVSGWAYLTNMNVANALVAEVRTNKYKYFWVDDAFVTGILREKIYAKVMDASQMFTANKEYLECCLNDDHLLLSRNRNNKSYWCDYIIGPSRGDGIFLKKFLQKSKSCFGEITCHRRPMDKILNKTCVSVRSSHDTPFRRTGVATQFKTIYPTKEN